MKFDKETLTKHRFWFLLGTAGPLALAAIFILIGIVGAQISKRQKELEDKLKPATDIKTPDDVKQMEVFKDAKKADEKVVWEHAYQPLIPYVTWPKEFDRTF